MTISGSMLGIYRFEVTLSPLRVTVRSWGKQERQAEQRDHDCSAFVISKRGRFSTIEEKY